MCNERYSNNCTKRPPKNLLEVERGGSAPPRIKERGLHALPFYNIGRVINGVCKPR